MSLTVRGLNALAASVTTVSLAWLPVQVVPGIGLPAAPGLDHVVVEASDVGTSPADLTV